MVCRKAVRILKSQQTRAALPHQRKNTPENPGCPCGEQFPGVPGESGQYARTPFPQHSPHASGFPTALPGKAKTPQVHRGAPAGSNCLASPVSWVTMPEPLFPSTAPTQADSPLHFPEKQKHPGFSGVFVFIMPHSRVCKRKVSPLSLCANCVQAQPG